MSLPRHANGGGPGGRRGPPSCLPRNQLNLGVRGMRVAAPYLFVQNSTSILKVPVRDVVTDDGGHLRTPNLKRRSSIFIVMVVGKRTVFSGCDQMGRVNGGARPCRLRMDGHKTSRPVWQL
eukprot:2147467-Pleurochrysis_carterae.AAC.2